MIWYRRTVAANCSIYLQCRCKRRNGRYISSPFWSFILTPRRKTDSIKDLYYPKLTRVNGVLITFFVTLTFLILSTAEEKNKSDCWCEIEDQVRKLRYGIRKAFNLSLTPFLLQSKGTPTSTLKWDVPLGVSSSRWSVARAKLLNSIFGSQRRTLYFKWSKTLEHLNWSKFFFVFLAL